jgi:hypothetical protein
MYAPITPKEIEVARFHFDSSERIGPFLCFFSKGQLLWPPIQKHFVKKIDDIVFSNFSNIRDKIKVSRAPPTRYFNGDQSGDQIAIVVEIEGICVHSFSGQTS